MSVLLFTLLPFVSIPDFAGLHYAPAVHGAHGEPETLGCRQGLRETIVFRLAKMVCIQHATAKTCSTNNKNRNENQNTTKTKNIKQISRKPQNARRNTQNHKRTPRRTTKNHKRTTKTPRRHHKTRRAIQLLKKNPS